MPQKPITLADLRRMRDALLTQTAGCRDDVYVFSVETGAWLTQAEIDAIPIDLWEGADVE